jgi:2-polyprenyl-3-methyl-5-hydroxy-6-metoxy-1,4-benzoquinol methylase
MQSDLKLKMNEMYAKGKEFVLFSDIVLDKVFKIYKPSGSALDLGCGTGSFSKQLDDRGMRVTGIDISDVAISKARANYPDIDFRVEDLFDHKEKYDIVAAKLLLAPAKDKDALLKKIVSLLETPGILIIDTPVQADGYSYEDEPHYQHVSVSSNYLDLLKKYFKDCHVISTSYSGRKYIDEVVVCKSARPRP